MHISQTQICFKYLPVYQTLHEYLLEAKGKRDSEKSTLKPQFVWSRQVMKPDNTSRYNIDDYEVQSNIKGYNERIKFHIHLIFVRHFLPELQYFWYSLRGDKPGYTYHTTCICLNSDAPDHFHLV